MITGFIASLPQDVRQTLEPLLKSTHCVRGAMLHDLSDTIESVWFPQKGTIVSLLIPLLDGESIETGFVGHWGLVGDGALLNGKTTLCKAEEKCSARSADLRIAPGNERTYIRLARVLP
jgi:hypothetical protein